MKMSTCEQVPVRIFKRWKRYGAN